MTSTDFPKGGHTVPVRILSFDVKRLLVGLVVVLTVALLMLSVRAARHNGLNMTVYPNPAFAGPPLVSGMSSSVALDFMDDYPFVPGGTFSVRWHGYWYVPHNGVIQLYGSADDRLDVWIDGDLVIRRTPPNNMHAVVRDLTLSAGAHELRIEYQQHGGQRSLGMGWALPGDSLRPIAAHQLFPERPSLSDFRIADRLARLDRLLFLLWAAAVLGGGILVRPRSVGEGRRPVISASQAWPTAGRVALFLVVPAIMASALLARLPAWNPESLWHDDLVYGVIIRADIWSLLTVPIHVAPGLFLVWHALYNLLPDPEWSLQLLPFVCALVAIPVMALAVRTLTRDDGLALLAAGATALNPLLAHYSVYVHQYSFDFLLTAVFLLLAAVYNRRGSEDHDATLWPLASLGAVGIFFSAPSVFVTFPLVHLGAVRAIRRSYGDRRRTINALLTVAAYDAAVLAGYLFMRNRTNEHVRGDFESGFLPLDSFFAAWQFLAVRGEHLLHMSLPGLGIPPWPLPFVGLGLVWLLVRRSTRFIGLTIAGTYCAFTVASALHVYPLATGRPDIFVFPLAIVLSVIGLQLATTLLRSAGLVRLALALLLATVAIAHPLRAEYWESHSWESHNSNGSFLVQYLAAISEPEDAVILEGMGVLLAAFYGPWSVGLAADDGISNATGVTIDRENTLHLPVSAIDVASPVRDFVSSGPRRVWVVMSARRQVVVGVLEEEGYAAYRILGTRNEELYLAIRDAGPRR